MSLANAAAYLDLDRWPRRAAFAFFRNFDIPCFNVCVRLDVTELEEVVRRSGVGTLSLAYHYLAIHLANEVEPFRYRLEGERVRVHPVVHGSTTVLRADQTFAFATLPYRRAYADFARDGAQALSQARAPEAGFVPDAVGTATVHLTTLPWLHFTSYTNARQWGALDSVPKIAFGRIQEEGGRTWMPLSLEVHHALMDGLSVGQYVQAFEAALRDAQAHLLGPDHADV